MDASMIFREIRRRLSLTRADCARLCEVSPSTVGRIEKGELDPTWGTLTRVLESSGFSLHGERVVPTGDAPAAVAARLVLDGVLDRVLGDGSSDPMATPMLTGPTELQVWWERWRRTGWLSDTLARLHIMSLARHAGVVSRDGRAAMPRLLVDDARRWRDLALRIGEAEFDYAVSDLAIVLERPGDGLAERPRIYVADPSTVASVLRLERSAPDRGVQLISADWPELHDIVAGDGVRFTSMGQAIMDGLTGSEAEHEEAARILFQLLVGRLQRS